jgi:membrane protease YdiL (CAAX protease family)
MGPESSAHPPGFRGVLSAACVPLLVLIRRRSASGLRPLVLGGALLDLLLFSLGLTALLVVSDASQWLRPGYESTCWLGAEVSRSSASGEGALVSEVVSDTPAQRAGITAGDRILQLDGIPIRNAWEVSWRLDYCLPDRPVRLTLARASGGAHEQLAILPVTHLTLSKRSVYAQFWGMASMLVLSAALCLWVVATERQQRWRVLALLLSVAAALLLPGLIPAAVGTRLSTGTALFLTEVCSVPLALWVWWRWDRRGGPNWSFPRRRAAVYASVVGASWMVRAWLLLTLLAVLFDVHLGLTAAYLEVFGRAEAEQPWLMYSVAVLLAPIVEELAFRGALLDGLCRMRGPRAAIVISALLFAAVHAPTHGGQVLLVAIVGLALGWLRCATGSLLLCIVGHSLFNTSAIALAFVNG